MSAQPPPDDLGDPAAPYDPGPGQVDPFRPAPLPDASAYAPPSDASAYAPPSEPSPYAPPSEPSPYAPPSEPFRTEAAPDPFRADPYSGGPGSDPYRFGAPEPGSPADLYRVDRPSGYPANYPATEPPPGEGPGGFLSYPPPPPAYYPGPQYPAPRQGGNGMAVAGLVLGILALLFCFGSFLDVPFVVLGIVFSTLGMSEGRPGGSGRGLAIAGLVCAILGGVGATGFAIWVVTSNT